MKILWTGTTGRIGREIGPWMRERYDLRTFDLEPNPQSPQAFAGDMQDVQVLEKAMENCGAVVHLAATSDEAPFHDQLLPNNIVGTFNVLEAARLAGVGRVVFASSVQAVDGNMWLGRKPGTPREEWGEQRAVRATDVPRPGTVYGATKVWGETLGRMHYDRHGMEFVSLRIGAFQPYNSDWFKEGRARDIWLSPRDMFQLLWRAIETPNVGYAIVHGTSRVPHERMSLEEAREVLGYVPEDNAEDFFAKQKD
jgi:uronate dehydrogenase